jgi:1-acyl-sn-glycerol-3-phosphate acyltransferase
MMVLRTVLFQAALICVTTAYCVLGLPLLAMPRRIGVPVLRSWAVTVMRLARIICGITFEIRGRENIPRGAAIVAVKHQSAWEALNLVHILADPSFVLKQELTRIPLFGWFAVKFGNLPVDRQGRARSLRRLVAGARVAAAANRPIVIFPEGTRRQPGAAPAYQRGIVALYRTLTLSCVPVALNSGLYWPARGWQRRPGRITVEFLPAIAPGLDGERFMSELTARIEDASNRLAEEAGQGPSGCAET